MSFYYLGCIEAIQNHWENVLEFVEKGLVKNIHNIKAREKACSRAPCDARIFLEADQLYKKMEMPIVERFVRLLNF